MIDCIVDNHKSTFGPVPKKLTIVDGEPVFVSNAASNPCCVCKTATYSYVEPCNHAVCGVCSKKLFVTENKKDHWFENRVCNRILYQNVTVIGYDCPKCNALISVSHIIT
jgi:hypothetical protein